MITLKRFRRLEAAVVRAGYAETIDWSENIRLPADVERLSRAQSQAARTIDASTSVGRFAERLCAGRGTTGRTNLSWGRAWQCSIRDVFAPGNDRVS
jgi:hypothetical protein